jgi:hypothetical protein
MAMEAKPLKDNEGSETGDVPVNLISLPLSIAATGRGDAPDPLLCRFLPHPLGASLAPLPPLSPHCRDPPHDLLLCYAGRRIPCSAAAPSPEDNRRQALPLATTALSVGSPSGPKNPAGRGSGGKMDPTPGMEAGAVPVRGGGAGMGGPDPAPNPTGATVGI